MLERRNSDRVNLKDAWIREESGDFIFSYAIKDLSEDGVFLLKKVLTKDQEAFSKFTFSLPNGLSIRSVAGRIIREENKDDSRGVAVQFLNLTEDARIALKKFILDNTIHGHA